MQIRALILCCASVAPRLAMAATPRHRCRRGLDGERTDRLFGPAGQFGGQFAF